MKMEYIYSINFMHKELEISSVCLTFCKKEDRVLYPI